MLNPPLFVRLTESESGQEEDILLSRIHLLIDFNDPDKLRSGTIVRTNFELGVLTPQGIAACFADRRYREKKSVIYDKMRKVVIEFRNMMQKSADSFDSEGEDWKLCH